MRDSIRRLWMRRLSFDNTPYSRSEPIQLSEDEWVGILDESLSDAYERLFDADYEYATNAVIRSHPTDDEWVDDGAFVRPIDTDPDFVLIDQPDWFDGFSNLSFQYRVFLFERENRIDVFSRYEREIDVVSVDCSVDSIEIPGVADSQVQDAFVWRSE